MMVLLLAEPSAQPISVDVIERGLPQAIDDAVPSEQERAIDRIERMTQLHGERVQRHVLGDGQDGHRAQVGHDGGRVDGLAQPGRLAGVRQRRGERRRVLDGPEELRAQHLDEASDDARMPVLDVVEEAGGDLGHLGVSDGHYGGRVVGLL